MLVKIKSILTTDLAKVSLLNGISTLIRMLTGFVSVKVVAVLIGPVGVALVGQLSNFLTIFLNVSTGGINTGITKYVAEHKDNKARFYEVLQAGFWITFILSLICGLILVIGSGYFSEIILKDVKYKSIFIVFGFTIMLYAFNAYLLSIINGLKEFKKFVTINIAGNIIGLIFSVVLAISFGIYGALLSLITYQSVWFIITLAIIAKASWFKWGLFAKKINRDIVIKLGHFSIMTLVTTATVPVGQLIIRNFIAKQTSLADAGIWEGMNRLSTMYLMVVTSSLLVYYLPRLSELHTRTEIRNEIMATYKFAIPALGTFFLLIYLFRNVIIHILFNYKFYSMERLFAFQLLGDYLRIMSYIISQLLLAKAMTKAYVITEIASNVSYVFIAMFFIKMYGNLGATISCAINFGLYFLMMVFIFRKILFKRYSDVN